MSPHSELSFSVLLFYQYLSLVCQPALWFTLFQFVRLLSAFAWPISSGFPARVGQGAFPLVVVEVEGETTSLYCPWSCLKLFCSLCISHLLPFSFPEWFFLFFTFALSVNPFSPKIQKSILHTVFCFILSPFSWKIYWCCKEKFLFGHSCEWKDWPWYYEKSCSFEITVMVYISGNYSSVQKDPEPQIKLHHPLLNNAASNNKKEGVLDPVTPLVTALSEKASLGFSTPSTEKKKSMER